MNDPPFPTDRPSSEESTGDPGPTPADLDALLDRAIREDRGSGDVTTEATVPPGRTGTGRIIAREPGVAAGLEVAARFFGRLDPAVRFEPQVRDGASVESGTLLARIEGPAASILTGERPALNLIQRMSGIATRTRAMVDAVAGFPARILDTRKTAPGLRSLDKWAVRLGGGHNHRMGLYDQVLIKENHVAAAGGIESAIRKTEQYLEEQARTLLVEIEARSLEEVDAVLAAGGIDRILLDNMTEVDPDGSLAVEPLRRAVERIGDRAETEASGNVTLETVGAIARTGVDYVSSGALTHSVRALDVSLLLESGSPPAGPGASSTDAPRSSTPDSA